MRRSRHRRKRSMRHSRRGGGGGGKGGPAAERAVTEAELATEKRFESVNEFRGTLDNQQRTLIPRSEVTVLIEGVNEKIANLTKIVDAMQAERAGIKGGWGYAVGVVGLLLALGSLGLIGLKFLSAGVKP